MESKRRLKVSALAEGLSATSLVLSVVTVASPYWGRFSNDGSPSSGGKRIYYAASALLTSALFTAPLLNLRGR